MIKKAVIVSTLWLAILPLPALPASASSVIGYVFAGTLSGSGGAAIDTLAVHPDYTLSPVRQTEVPGAYIDGMGLVHTKGGISLYAEIVTSRGSQADTIYQFSVKRAGAVLTAKKPFSVGAVAAPLSGEGNNLFAFDGYGRNGKGTSSLHATGCPDSSCSDPGVARYKVDPATGRLSLAAPVVGEQSALLSMSLSGDHLDVLFRGKQDQIVAVAGAINPSNGIARFGRQYRLPAVGHPPVEQTASIIAAAQDRLALYEFPIPGPPTDQEGAGIYRVTGNTIGHLLGDTPEVQGEHVSTLAFSNNVLIAGEYQAKPALQILPASGSGTARFIDLSKSPFSFPTGSEFDPNFVTQPFTLGRGVYIGCYQGSIVQATDGPGKKGFAVNAKNPTVPVQGTRAMAGYLLP